MLMHLSINYIMRLILSYAPLCGLMHVWRMIYPTKEVTNHPIGVSEMCKDIIVPILFPPRNNERFSFPSHPLYVTVCSLLLDALKRTT